MFQVDLAAGVRVRISPQEVLLFKLLRRELDDLVMDLSSRTQADAASHETRQQLVVGLLRHLMREEHFHRSK